MGHQHSALKALVKGGHAHSEQELLEEPSQKGFCESLSPRSIHNQTHGIAGRHA